MWHPMAHPTEMRGKPPELIMTGEGVTIIDIGGYKTLDAVGGLWKVNLGYSCEPIKKAITDQYTMRYELFSPSQSQTSALQSFFIMTSKL